MLHPLSDFIDPMLDPTGTIADSPPTYWYRDHTQDNTQDNTQGSSLQLPRTRLAEAIAHSLMQQLDLMQQLSSSDRHSHEGKMYGILLVDTASGVQVLKAFSGLLNGSSTVPGWVPPLPGRSLLAIEEARTLTTLDRLKQELIALQQLPARQDYIARSRPFETRLQQLTQQQQQQRQVRQEQRQQFSETLAGEALAIALDQLDNQSRQDSTARRRLKQERDAALLPLKQAIAQADAQIRDLKQQRKALSQSLQAQLHQAYSLTNFAGESIALQQLKQSGALPTGTGDCCAPKLLNYAATHQLKPLAMAEFWWGAPSAHGDKVSGEFYGACADRCQPLMGFLLSGLPQSSFIASNPELILLYEDEWIIAVNKPAGLLSVPGRTSDRQHSVLSQLRRDRSQPLIPVHRLDQDTSGILLLACDRQTHRQLSRQFQQRQVFKAYEAVLAGVVAINQGTIDLPLWADPSDRPYQKVDWQRGKPSLTQFRVLDRTTTQTRIELVPITGRTHQLRVHAADSNGLGAPILGDRLYGDRASQTRLQLHAKELQFQHPQSGNLIKMQSKTPF
jgi:tRNA pseudouridine32 synthase / 23S rRNA pseudouridine746 synthase